MLGDVKGKRSGSVVIFCPDNAIRDGRCSAGKEISAKPSEESSSGEARTTSSRSLNQAFLGWCRGARSRRCVGVSDGELCGIQSLLARFRCASIVLRRIRSHTNSWLILLFGAEVTWF